MRLSKQQVLARLRKIPRVQFEDQRLTSFGGVIVFQALFQQLGLLARLQDCFRHLKDSGAYGIHRVVLLLVVHLLLGFRALRDVAYYRDDPLVQRLVGLRCIPDAATLSRTLKRMDFKCVRHLRQLVRSLVTEGCRDRSGARALWDPEDIPPPFAAARTPGFHGHVSPSPPAIPDGRVSRVRF